jgi:hypothetical protein
VQKDDDKAETKRMSARNHGALLKKLNLRPRCVGSHESTPCPWRQYSLQRGLSSRIEGLVRERQVCGVSLLE